ncbi:phage tail assembly chaperone [Antarcticirhabdus aurantiaca]|uniref:Uncharacterized protein n=1 Tax=Antarcticirhabdus aurantiaca TaxID=2606717 RepID=A0ACD4NVL0_9HYPH|nr:hypothetical protein OXU80_12385 [Jeongeuplla avenae]
MVLNREPEVPAYGEHLLEWFWDINKGRQHTDGTWLALPPSEMKAWQEMTGNIVRREEWAILRDMEVSYLRAVNARDKEGAPIASSSSEMSTAAFDAVFG